MIFLQGIYLPGAVYNLRDRPGTLPGVLKLHFIPLHKRKYFHLLLLCTPEDVESFLRKASFPEWSRVRNSDSALRSLYNLLAAEYISGREGLPEGAYH
jgi:hypothetical protein